MVLVLACVMGLSCGGLVLALDPNSSDDARKDIDGDDLNNLMEFMYGCDPTNPDTDGDLLPVGYEAGYDMNRAQFPQSSKWARYDSNGDGVNDVNVDPNYKFDPTVSNALDLADQDGWDTLQEYLVGTDPTNPDTDGDGRPDDVDPWPLIPDPAGEDGHNGTEGNHSGMSQGYGLGYALSVGWSSFTIRGF